jgi:hypothetical protein
MALAELSQIAGFSSTNTSFASPQMNKGDYLGRIRTWIYGEGVRNLIQLNCVDSSTSPEVTVFLCKPIANSYNPTSESSFDDSNEMAYIPFPSLAISSRPIQVQITKIEKRNYKFYFDDEE